MGRGAVHLQSLFSSTSLRVFFNVKGCTKRNIQSCETLTNTFGLDFLKKTYSSCVWWHTPVILAFRRQRQEDCILRLA